MVMFPGPLDSFDPTDKQSEIIRNLFDFADRGTFPTLDELKASLSYGPKVTKQAIRCSLQFLELWGAVEIVYGENQDEEKKQGRRLRIKPTPATYRRFRPPVAYSL